MARKRDLSALSPAYRRRLERSAAKQGLSLDQLRTDREAQRKARGHGATPEHGSKKVMKAPYHTNKKGEPTAEQSGIVPVNKKGEAYLPTPEEAEKMAAPHPRDVLRALKDTKTPVVRVAVLLGTRKSPKQQDRDGKDVRWFSTRANREDLREIFGSMLGDWGILDPEERHDAMLAAVEDIFGPLQYEADAVLGWSFADSHKKEA